MPSRASARASLLRSEKPVVVLGRGKSGTRLVPKCLESLGVVMHARKETPASDVDDRIFQKAINLLAARYYKTNRDSEVRRSDLILFQVVAHRYLKIIRANPNSMNMWGWKFPETYLVVPILINTFPDAHLIHIIRDGRDISFKIHQTDNENSPIGRGILEYVNAIGQPHHLQAALSWEYQVINFRKSIANSGNVSLLELRYEDICADPAEMLRQVADFLSIRADNKSINFVRSWIHSREIKQYSSEESVKIGEIEEKIGPTLGKFGYLD